MTESLNAADKYINGLNYDARNILVDNSGVPDYKKEDGLMEDDGTYVVIKKKQCTVENNTSELTYMDSLASRLFPGTMVLCNSNLVTNNPQVVNLPTNSTKFTIDLPDINGEFQVNELTKCNLETAIKEKIKEWKSKNNGGNITAKVKYNLYEVKNRHQLSAALGLNLKDSKFNFNIDFSAVEKSESKDWILKFEQIYFNVTLNSFYKPSDIVSSSVTEEDIKGYGVNNDNPLGIVNNINYGRIIYVHFKTSKTDFDLKSKINTVINSTVSMDEKSSLDYNDVKENVSLDVFVYGGGSSAFKSVPQINIDTIHKFIEQGYSFDTEQEAVPIGYSVVFMKYGGQELATVNSSSTYIETTTTRYKSAHLKLKQRGAFVNHFNITWNEISYDNNGNPIITPKSWEHNGQDCCVGENYDLFFKGNVRNLHITSKGYTGIAWNKTRINFDQDVTLSPQMTLTVKGTTLNQKCNLTCE